MVVVVVVVVVVLAVMIWVVLVVVVLVGWVLWLVGPGSSQRDWLAPLWISQAAATAGACQLLLGQSKDQKSSIASLVWV